MSYTCLPVTSEDHVTWPYIQALCIPHKEHHPLHLIPIPSASSSLPLNSLLFPAHLFSPSQTISISKQKHGVTLDSIKATIFLTLFFHPFQKKIFERIFNISADVFVSLWCWRHCMLTFRLLVVSSQRSLTHFNNSSSHFASGLDIVFLPFLTMPIPWVTLYGTTVNGIYILKPTSFVLVCIFNLALCDLTHIPNSSCPQSEK